MDGYPSVGSIVSGRYRIDAVLGEGGMGAVFAATDQSGNRFALKFPAPEMRSRPGMMSRFANEAVAASRIASEHVVRVLGVEATEQGVPFMVMELLEGTDLDHVIETQAPLDIPRSVHFALQILRALQVAHAHGVVHRDLKPSNCFVIRSGDDPEFVKLIDFGITKILGDEAQNLTRTSVTMGTPSYMAPEQAKSAKAAEPRSDLYSVGVILYELLSKRRPFEGDSQNELVIKICTEPPLPIRDVRPDLPPGLASAVERALVKAPAGRFASAAAFADALKPFSDARSSAVLAQIEIGVPTPAPNVVIAPIGGSTAAMSGMGPTEPGATPPMGAQGGGQKTLVAEGPLVFADAMPPTMPADAAYGGNQAIPGTLMGAPAPLPMNAPMNPPMGSPMPNPALVASASPAIVPAISSPPSTQGGGGGGRGALIAILGVLAVGLIGTGIYFAVASRPSSAPAPAPAATKDKDNAGDDDDDEPTKKKKKPDQPSDEPGKEPAPAPAPNEPPPAAGTKPKPKPSTSASTTAPVPSASTSTKPTTGPSGTTTAPTIVLPPGWPPFPTGTIPPAGTTAPPATTTAPTTGPTTPPTVAPPATTTPPASTMPTIISIPKKPKLGGK